MANETVYSNFQTVAAYVDANLAPYFRPAAIMPNLMHLVDLGPGSDSKKLRKAGALTATAATEATDHANSQYAISSPNTLTVAEVKVYVEISKKAQKFAEADLAEIAAEAGRACAQKFDTDAMALFDSLNGGTQVGTSGVDCSPEILLQASYTLEAQNIPGPYVYVLHPTQIFDVNTDILTSGAAVWSNETKLSLLNGQPPQVNGWKGSFLGIDVHASTNVESVNTAADWAGACFSPRYALAAAIAGGVETEVDRDIKKGVIQLAITMWYDVKEYNDLAGVSIETDQ